MRDAHGDPVGLLSATATSVGTTSFDPWGQVLTSTGTQPVLGYQGDYTDPVTKQVDMGTRWYAPQQGRFSTRDVVFGDPMHPVSLNQFVYGAANPITMWDPTGMSYRSLHEGGCGGLGQPECEQTVQGFIDLEDEDPGYWTGNFNDGPDPAPPPPAPPPPTPDLTVDSTSHSGCAANCASLNQDCSLLDIGCHGQSAFDAGRSFLGRVWEELREVPVEAADFFFGYSGEQPDCLDGTSIAHACQVVQAAWLGVVAVKEGVEFIRDETVEGEAPLCGTSRFSVRTSSNLLNLEAAVPGVRS
jgi:RHS repeat-associated protein